jgi:hypothetical protein
MFFGHETIQQYIFQFVNLHLEDLLLFKFWMQVFHQMKGQAH